MDNHVTAAAIGRGGYHLTEISLVDISVSAKSKLKPAHSE